MSDYLMDFLKGKEKTVRLSEGIHKKQIIKITSVKRLRRGKNRLLVYYNK